MKIKDKLDKKDDYQKKYNKPHLIIPADDLQWAISQKPSVNQLWQECWLADPYGSRWIQLNSCLKRSSFMAAKKVIKQSGLFVFQRQTSMIDGRETVCWMIRNLHGSRVKEFWQQSNCSDLESTNSDSIYPEIQVYQDFQQVSVSQTQILHPSKFMDNLSINSDNQSTPLNLESTNLDSIYPEIQLYQDFQQASVTFQQHLSNSSKELLRCGAFSEAQPERAALPRKPEEDPECEQSGNLQESKPGTNALRQGSEMPPPPANYEDIEAVKRWNEEYDRRRREDPEFQQEMQTGFTKIREFLHQKGLTPEAKKQKQIERIIAQLNSERL